MGVEVGELFCELALTGPASAIPRHRGHAAEAAVAGKKNGRREQRVARRRRGGRGGERRRTAQQAVSDHVCYALWFLGPAAVSFFWGVFVLLFVVTPARLGLGVSPARLVHTIAYSPPAPRTEVSNVWIEHLLSYLLSWVVERTGGGGRRGDLGQNKPAPCVRAG